VIIKDGELGCEIVPLNRIELISTLWGSGNFWEISVSAKFTENSEILPRDLFVGKGGFVTIGGLKGGKPVGRNGEEIDINKLFLVRRDLPWGERKRVLVAAGEAIEVSQFAIDIAHTRFLQGDEVEVAGERAIVVGCDSEYVWMIADNGEFLCTNEGLGDGDIRLVCRPAKNPSVLFDCFTRTAHK
jgi:hypothetical protein